MRFSRRKTMQAAEESFFFLTSEVVAERLKNGMKVFVKQVYPASVVNLAIWVRVGSVNETDAVAGISHFIEHMLFKGTEKRAVGEIAREIHGCGGYMNAFTDFECTCYWIVLPSKYLDVALDVQADALLHSTFEEAELRKECRVIIEELKMYEDRPEAFAFEKLMALAYEKHPYGRPIIGFEDTLLKISRQDLLHYFRRHYFAENMFVTLVGDVNPTRAIRKIKNALQEIPSLARIESGERDGRETGRAAQNNQEPQQKDFRRRELVGDIARSHVQMGFHVPNALHPDYYVLRVLGAILGDGKSSRLNLSLCEKKRLVDHAEAGVFAEKDPGIFYVNFMLEDRNIEKAEQGVWEEIDKLQNDLVSPEELLKAKNMIESSYIFSQETVEGQGKNMGYYECLGDYRLSEKFIENLFFVTPDAVREAARLHLAKKNCSEIVYHSRS